MSVVRLADYRERQNGTEKRMQDGFVAIPNHLFDAILSADIPARHMKVAMAVIRKTIGFGKAEDDCTIQQLADVAGIHRPDASKAFHALVEAKIISARVGKYGYLVSVNGPEMWDLSPYQNATHSATNVAKRYERTERNATHNRQSQKTVIEEANASSLVCKQQPRRTAKTQAIPEHFDAFWAEYPKRKAKKDAIKAFAKLHVTDELLETILADLRQRKMSAEWLENSGQYIPLPASYLNGERWADEQVSISEAWTAEQASFLEILAQELPVVVPPSEWTASRARAIDAMLAKLSHDLDTVRASLRRMNSRIDPDRFGIQTFDHWAKPETRDRIRAGHYDKGGQHGR